MSPSNLTMGDYGCLVTCEAMIVSNYALDRLEPDGDITPGELCDRVITNGGFGTDGNEDGMVLNKVWKQMYWLERVYTTNFPDKDTSRMEINVALRRIKRLIALGQPVILHVDYPNDNDAVHRPDHFIVCYSSGWDCIDAYDGRRLKLPERYGIPEKAIFGYLAYIGPAIGYEDTGDSAAGSAAWKLSQVLKKMSINDPNRQYVKEALDILIYTG